LLCLAVSAPQNQFLLKLCLCPAFQDGDLAVSVMRQQPPKSSSSRAAANQGQKKELVCSAFGYGVIGSAVVGVQGRS
jgi:hypothetical protein